jgi:glutathione synthase/RimK-type ligase-like ATP-grasp enzyme
MIIILVNKTDGTYGATQLSRALRYLGIDCVIAIQIGKKWFYTREFSFEIKYVLRWGTTFEFPNDEHAVTFNTPIAIFNTYNKKRARHIHIENSVPIPKTWFELEAAQIPFIARPNLHTGGKDFHVVFEESDKEKLPKGSLMDWYYSAVYPKTKEFRVHVWGNTILVAYEKPIGIDLRANQTINNVPWYELKEIPKGLADVAISACVALQLDTGAVDIMHNPNHNEPYVVCEVNTMPTIKTKRLANFYATHIKQLIWQH